MWGTNMNTEFPSRIPTVSSSSTNGTRDANLASSLERVVKSLNDFSKVLDKITKNAKTGGPNEYREEPKSDNNYNKREEKQGSKFRAKVLSAWESTKNAIVSVFNSLKDSFSDAVNSISGAIGDLFGSGILGNFITKIVRGTINGAIGLVTKSMKLALKGLWSAGKMIVSHLIANLPQTLFYSAIIAGITTLAILLREGWEYIKQIGYAIDQGIDAIMSIFGESKYESARQELADFVGASPEELLEIYGDTIKGRNQMYEDYKTLLEADEEDLANQERTEIWQRIKKDLKELREEEAEYVKANKDNLMKLQAAAAGTNPEMEALKTKTLELYQDSQNMGAIDANSINLPTEESIGLGGTNINTPTNVVVETNNTVLTNNLQMNNISADNPMSFSTLQGYPSTSYNIK